MSEQNLVTASPNPATGSTTVTFRTNGGHTLLQLVSNEGIPLETLLEATYGSAQTINKNINLSPCKTGIYYLRLQNGKNVRMRPVVKMR